MRYVSPYRFEYRAYAKGRWFGRTILDVFTKVLFIFQIEEVLKFGYNVKLLQGRIKL